MITDKEREFLQESNYIEQEYSKQAMKDAIKAYEYAKRHLCNICISYILEIHNLLMKNIRPDIAGKFRDCDVWIGGKRRIYVCDDLFRTELKNSVCLPMTSNKKSKDFAKEIHVSFETIHPFEDGNGRVGRILYAIHLQKMGFPLHIIHEGEEQFEYYKWFK